MILIFTPLCATWRSVLTATPWTVPCQAPLFKRLCRNLPSPGTQPRSPEPVSPAAPEPAGVLFTTLPPGRRCIYIPWPWTLIVPPSAGVTGTAIVPAIVIVLSIHPALRRYSGIGFIKSHFSFSGAFLFSC